jgi:hypothetical protein
MAARSSALVGSLIGVRAGTGEDGADCLPHEAVAFLTEANADFPGDGSSFLGESSTFGGAISFNAVGLGLSVLGLMVFAGGMGSGREKRDCKGAGDGEGDAIFGDWIACGSVGLCGVLWDPDTLRSGSNEAGFFGIPGEEVRGDGMESGRDVFFAKSCEPDTLRSRSSGFFGGSGVALPY